MWQDIPDFSCTFILYHHYLTYITSQEAPIPSNGISRQYSVFWGCSSLFDWLLFLGLYIDRPIKYIYCLKLLLPMQIQNYEVYLIFSLTSYNSVSSFPTEPPGVLTQEMIRSVHPMINLLLYLLLSTQQSQQKYINTTTTNMTSGNH